VKVAFLLKIIHPLRMQLFGWLVAGIFAVLVIAAIAIIAIAFVFVIAPLALFVLLPIGVLLLILLAALFVFGIAFRGWRWKRHGYYYYASSSDSREILRQRYVRGEISKEQLEEGLRTINDSYQNENNRQP
jgi:uncharacterized membrane protein